MIRVKDNPDLVKDPRSGAVINVNNRAMLTAKQRKERNREKEARFDQLEHDVSDMKEILGAILDKLNNEKRD